MGAWPRSARLAWTPKQARDQRALGIEAAEVVAGARIGFGPASCSAELG